MSALASLGTLRALLSWYWRAGHTKVRNAVGAPKRVYASIGNFHTEVENENRLKSFLPTEASPASFVENRRVIYGPPVDSALLPVWSVVADYCCPTPRIRLRVGLFTLDGEQVRSCGFRFESPESPGDHNLFHAQLISEFEGQPLKGVEWVPESVPAIPIDASDPADLVVAVLVALYGRKTTSKMLVGQPFMNRVRPILEKMRMTAIGDEIKYWSAECGGVRKYFKTQAPEADFKRAVKRWRGCKDPRESSEAIFEQQPVNVREEYW